MPPAATLTLGELFVYWLVTAAITYIIARVLAPDIDMDSGDERIGHLQTIRDTQAPVFLPYGRCRVGINQVYLGTTGSDNEYLHMIGVLGEGPVKGIVREDLTIYETTGSALPTDNPPLVYFGDELFTEYNQDFIHIEFFDGSSTQNTCSTLNTAIPDWDEPQRYTTYIYVRVKYDREDLPRLPDITVVLEGLELYNPITLTTAYSNNAALCAYHFVTQPSTRGGMGVLASRINTTELSEAIDYCTTKGWTCNMPITDNQYATDNLKLILANFRGAMVMSENQVKITFRDLNYETVVANLVEADLVDVGGETSLTIEQPDIFERPNAIRAKYLSELEHKYQINDYVYTDQTALASDGDYRELAVAFYGLSELDLVQKMAFYALERSRLNKMVSFTARTEFLKLEPLDVITLTHTMPGWSQKLLRVLVAKPNEDFTIDIVTMEEATILYDDIYNLSAEAWYDTYLPSPTDAVPGVINVSSEEETYYYRGRTFTRWIIRFSPPPPVVYPWWSYAEIFIKIGTAVELEELVTDGGIEEWTGDTPNSWQKIEDGASVVTDETSIVHGGLHSAKITIDGSGSGVGLQEPIAFVNGYYCELVVWLYGDGSGRVRILDTEDATGSLDEEVTPLAVWTKYTFNWTANANSDYIKFLRANPADVSWSFYIDDVYIHMYTPEPEYKLMTTAYEDYVLDPVEEGEVYFCKIRSVNIYGKKESIDSAVVVSKTILGYDDIPSDLVYLTAVANGDTVSIYSDEIPDPDIVGYEVRLGDTWAGAILMSVNLKPSLRLVGVRPGTHEFWMSPIDNDGNYSDNPVSAEVVVFIPPGFTELPTYSPWEWDFSTGVFCNCEQYIDGSAIEWLRLSVYQEKLVDGGFENGDFTDWTAQGSSTIESVEINTGIYSAELTASGSAIDGCYDEHAINPYAMYQFNQYVYIKAYSAGTFHACKIDFLTDAKALISSVKIDLTSTVAWTEYTKSIGPVGSGADHIIPVNTAYVRVFGGRWADTPTGEAYVDDCTFKMVSVQAIANGTCEYAEPTFWGTVLAVTNGTKARNTNWASDGSYSIEYTGDGSTAADHYLSFDDIGVTPFGVNYNLSFDVYITNGNTVIESLQLKIKKVNRQGDETWVDLEYTVTKGTLVTLNSVTDFTADERLADIYIGCELPLTATSDTFYVDMWSAEQVSKLVGKYISPTHDLTAIEKVRVWGDFITAFVAGGTTFGGVMGEVDTFGDHDADTKSFSEIFEPSIAGQLKAVLCHKETSGADWTKKEFFEILCAEVEARYLACEVTITNPTNDASLMLEELDMVAYEGPQ